MKSTTLLLILACTAGAEKPPAGRCPDPAIDNALRKVAEDWKDGYNRGDAASVADLYSEDAHYLTHHYADGVVAGRAAIRAYVQLGVDARYKVASIRILSSGCSGDLAYTVGTYESDNVGKRDFGVNLVVLRRMGGKWKIVAHESAVPDRATAIRELKVEGPRPAAPR